MAPATPLVDQTDLTIYKGLLYQYTQKNKLPFPTYNITMTGEPHKPSFMATVTINGTCYKGEQCPTKKIAEGKAARVAVTTIMGNGDAKEENVVEPNVGSYKTALQEYTHKHRWLDPQYEVTMEGDPHVPSFVATVIVNGVLFRGKPSLKKKEAEGKVAKIALLTLLSNSDELRVEATKDIVSNDDANSPSSEIMEQRHMEAPIEMSYEDALLPTSKVMEHGNARNEHMNHPHVKQKKLAKRTRRVKTGLTYTILGKYLIVKRKKKPSKRKLLSAH